MWKLDDRGPRLGLRLGKPGPRRTAIRLTASLIVRDEEHFLPGCLDSVAPIVDEIVVVDTGSTDRTPSIAREHGARVVDFPWQGDFAAARNVGLAEARSPWILYIDADERVRPCAPEVLEELEARTDCCCLTVRFHPRVGATAYREYRLLRNHPDIRFAGVIHETVVPSLRAMERKGWKIEKSDLTIDHLGYEGDQRRKHERNLPLLEEGVKRDPDRMYNWWHLGSVYLALGRERAAEKAWRHAVELVRAKNDPGAVDTLPYTELLRLSIRRDDDFSSLLAEARARFPWCWSFAWLEAAKRSADGDHEKAAELYAQMAAVDPDAIVDEGLSYDEAIFGRFALEGVATSLFRLGRYAESADAYERALALDPANNGYMAKLALARARASAIPADEPARLQSRVAEP